MRLARAQAKRKPGTIPALFIHIQKTAGTTLINHARRYYGGNLTSHGDCWGAVPEKFGNVAFISGHIGYHFARQLMPGRYTFTFLRNPVERILSHYYFCRTRDPAEFEIYKCASEMHLIEFLHAGLSDPLVKKNIWNNQVWQLAHGYGHLDDRTIDTFDELVLLREAKDHLDELSDVGLTENFSRDAERILRALELPRIGNSSKDNAGPRQRGAIEKSVEARDLLEQLTNLDWALYDYAKETRSTRRAPSLWQRLWR